MDRVLHMGSNCECKAVMACVVTAGEVAVVGPAISALDADVGAAAHPSGSHKNAAEAKRAAQQCATALEVRSMLGIPSAPLRSAVSDARTTGIIKA